MTLELDRPSLSATELEILQLLATGATNREIARERGISEATVKKHVTNINVKLATGNRTEAVRRALELGLVTVDSADGRTAPDMEAARRLAHELDRTRTRSRRINAVSIALALAAFAATLAVFVFDSDLAPRIGPDPTSTPPSAPPSVAPAPGWLPGRDLPTSRSGIALVSDGHDVFAIGGEDASGVLADSLRYDIDRITWRAVARKPTAVRDVGVVLIDGRFVVPGGCARGGRATDVVEIYDPRSDTWSSSMRLPEPVCGYALAEYSGRAYLFGGRSGADLATAGDRVWRYEPESGQWLDGGRLPLKRCDLAAVRVGDRIHLLGGVDPSGRPQTSHWAYSPLDDMDAWNTEGGPPLPEARAGLVAAGLQNGYVFVLGGGWDRALDDGALVWDSAEDGADWRPYVDPRGPTAQRGMGLAVHLGQWLHVAGGEVDGRLLDQNQTIRVLWILTVPQGPR